MDGGIAERDVEVAGVRVHLRERAGEGTPVVLVHGNPTSSLDWLPFMDRLPGPAIAFDLPGWGRSDRPDPLLFDGSMGAHANLIEKLLDRLAPDRYRLAVHDWGGVALVAAQRHPARVERLAVVNAVPLLPGYRWHWVARIWRRRGLGELFNATATKRATALILRQARAGNRPMPEDFVDALWEPFDAGTRRAILALYRSADPEVLAASGSRLSELRCPALVLWGQDDPYLAARFGGDYAEALPDAELVELDDAGHWPWLDRPDAIDLVVEHLTS